MFDGVRCSIRSSTCCIAGVMACAHGRNARSRRSNAPVLLVVGDSISAGYGLRGRQGLGDAACRSGSRRKAIATGRQRIDQRRHDGGRPRAAAALLAQHKPAIVIVELGGNDALRGGNLATTRDNLDAMVAAAQAAGAKVLIVGMQLPPNYGPPTCGSSSAVRRRREGASACRSCPRSSPASATTWRSSSPTASIRPLDAQPQAARQRLAGAAAAAAQMNVPTPRHGPGTQGRIGALAAHPERIDVRSPSEFAIDHIPGAVNLPVLDDDERTQVGTLHAQESAFAAASSAPRSSRATSRASSRRIAAASRATGRRSSIAGAAASAARRSRTC